MGERFHSKREARQAVWDRLQAEKAARFPYPPHGRIPNFEGAAAAAARLLDAPLLHGARRIKVNPDAPQRPVRQAALGRGIVVFMPTPRLREGFLRLDPRRIPADRLDRAAALSEARRWGEPVPVHRLPRMDAIVTGCVAVTPQGRRCGKGEGYSDLEFAILRELGHPAVPVATTVHPLQLVENFPRDPFDLPVSLVVTPDAALPVPEPPPAPDGIRWELLSEADLDRMPVLRELRAGPGGSGGRGC